MDETFYTFITVTLKCMSDFTDGHACNQIFMDVVVVKYHEDSLHNQCSFGQQRNC